MSWNAIIGQARVKKLLKATLENKRLAHAYLFSGPEGVGKDAAAIELAKIVNCTKKGINACDDCPSCQNIGRLQHPNVNLVFALPVGKGEEKDDAPLTKLTEDDMKTIRKEIELKAGNPYHVIQIPKANNIKINSIREIRKESSMTAFESGKKVFIIIAAENLSDVSSNALLKTLEEPHDDTLLILTTSQPDALLPTIISRCQHVRFDMLSVEEIQHSLQERGIEKQQAVLIAQLSKGSFSRALELTETTLLERQADAVNFLRNALYKSQQHILEDIERIFTEYQKDDIEEFFLLLQAWLQSAMMAEEGYASSGGAPIDETLRKFVQHHPDLRYTELLTSTSRAISLLHKNVYIPLILLNLAIEVKKIILPSSVSKNMSAQTAVVKGIS